LADGSYTVTADVTDHAGNPATQATHGLAVDETAPSVVVSISDPELNASETATVTFAFSEAPVGFTLDDATAVGGSLSDLQMVDRSEERRVGKAGGATETAAASVSVAGGSYADAAGNPGAAGRTGEFTVGTVAP